MILPRESLEGLRLSPHQERIWRLQSRLGSRYRSCGLATVRGSFDLGAARSALDRVVAGHEILRTSFRSLPEMELPLQVVGSSGHLEWEESDVEAPRGTRDLEERFAGWLEAGESLEPGGTEPPLVRCRAGRLAGGGGFLFLDLSSLVVDREGVVRLLAEWERTYAGGPGAGGAAPDILQYGDLSEWLNQTLDSEDGEEAREFWSSRSPSGGRARPLPFHLEPAAPAGEPLARLTIPLDRDLAAAWPRVAERAGGAPCGWLLAVWSLLLARLTGSSELEVGVTFDGRNYPEIAPVIGSLARVLPMVLEVPSDRPLGNWSARLEAELEEMADWQHGHPKRSPEERVRYGFELHEPVSCKPAGPGRLRIELCRQRVDEVDLRLVGHTAFGGPRLELEYLPAAFDRRAVELLGGQLRSLLEHAAAAPDDFPVERLSALGTEERRQLVIDFNQPRREMPAVDVVEAAAESARTAPDRPAVVCGDRVMPWRELDLQTGRISALLRARGAGPGGRVVVCLERTTELVAAILGVLRVGAAYVPVDLDWPMERRTGLARDCAGGFALTRRGLLEGLPADVEEVLLDGEPPPPEDHSGQPATPVPETAPAYVIYTSGSTGRPKGVVVSRGALARYVAGIRGVLMTDAPLSFATPSSLAVDLANTALFVALAGGGCFHLLSRETASDPELLGDYCARHRLDALKIVPSHFQALLSGDRPERLIPRRFLVLGGETCGWDLVDRVRDLAPDTTVVNHYGPTEATIGALVNPIEPGCGRRAASVPIGRPLGGVRAYLVDPRLEPVPTWAPGEILLGGAGLAQSYLERPRATAESFIPDPLGGHPGRRLYRTGDLGRHRGGGDVEFLGRRDDQVKIRGFRVEPEEVARRLTAHASVIEAAVLPYGEAEGLQLVAYVAARGPADVDTLRAHLGRGLPNYMVPASFVVLERLPRSANGKVDRRALPAPGAGGVGEYVPPRNPVEETLVEVWHELLGRDRIGVQDNFFHLGGDSILSIQVVAKARKRGLRLVPRQLFEHQTVADLATVAEPLDRDEPARPPAHGPVPLTPVQRRFFGAAAAPDHHDLPVWLRLRRRLPLGRLEEALHHLVRHHDALRHRFTLTAGEWRQTCRSAEEAPPPTVVRIDLSALPSEHRAGELVRAATAIHEALRLDEGPLLRAELFTLGEEDGTHLLLTAHHAVVDGVSWRILLRDLEGLCDALEAGRPPELPPRTTTFQEWADGLEALAASDALAGEVELWRRLQPPPDAAWHAPEGARTGAERSLSVALGETETRAIVAGLRQAHGISPEEALATAFVAALCEITGDAGGWVDFEGHGRSEELLDGADLSRTVGWFTAVFPVYVEAPTRSLLDAAGRLRSRLHAVPHGGLGYGLLRYGRGESAKTLSTPPSPWMSFNYLGRFEDVLRESRWFGPSGVPGGRARDPRDRAHALEATASTLGERMRLTLTARGLPFAERLLQGWAKALSRLIGESLRPEELPRAAAAGEAADGAGVPAPWDGVEEVYPLAPLQRGLLFHSLHDRGTGTYVSPSTGTIVGDLDVEALRRAWDHVLAAHPVLRTEFRWDGRREPVQVVRAEVEMPWTEIDLRNLEEADQEDLFQGSIRRAWIEGLPLDAAPLMRFTLLRVADRAYRFLWTHHHLILDGWSKALLTREIFAAYRAFEAGDPPPTISSRPYSDFVAWLDRQDLEEASSFWRRYLDGFEEPISLERLERGPGEPREGYEYLERSRHLARGATEELALFARRNRLTLNTVLQGAWSLMLGFYAGRRDVVFGTVVSGRPPELEGSDAMLGLFINNLPLRVRLDPEAGVTSWLAQLQETQVAQRQYEHSPLVEIRRWVDFPGNRDLFDTIFVFENYPADPLDLDLGRVRLEAFEHRIRNNYPLTLRVMPGRSLGLYILFDAQVYAPAVAEWLLDDLVTVVTAIAKGPDRRLVDLLDLLEEADRARSAAAHALYEDQIRQRLSRARGATSARSLRGASR